MAVAKTYEEIVDFVAEGHGPQEVSEFQPPDETKGRVAFLVAREKGGEITGEETREFESYLQLEHLMRLAKARARIRVAASAKL